MEVKLYNWQKRAVRELKKNSGKNILITAPTGSGKTLVGYVFLGIFNTRTKEFQNPPERVIYTAPLKSLTNDKYFELKKKGLDVGILTGDVKINENAKIIVCTQEVYQERFKGKGYKVFIDEWHYAFQNPQRALSFVNLSEKDRYLLASATIKVEKSLLEYLKKITGRDFIHINARFRPTKLIFKEEAVQYENLKEIYTKGNLVLSVAFSRKSLKDIADFLEEIFEDLSNEELKKIEEELKRFKLNLPPYYLRFLKKGIAIYHGKLNYTIKVFIESLARKKLLRTIISTDAISLGVNFPISDIVFYSLKKFDGRYFRKLYKSEFLQISGRAGRKGFFEEGRIWAVGDDLDTDRDFETYEIYRELLKEPLENPRIDITIDLKYTFDFIRENWQDAEEIAKFFEHIPPNRNRRLEHEISQILFYRRDEESIKKRQKIEEFTKGFLDDVSRFFRLKYPYPLEEFNSIENVAFYLTYLIALKKQHESDKAFQTALKLLDIKELNPIFLNEIGFVNENSLNIFQSLYRLSSIVLQPKLDVDRMLYTIAELLKSSLLQTEKASVLTTALRILKKANVYETHKQIVERLLKELKETDKIISELISSKKISKLTKLTKKLKKRKI